VLLQQPGLDPLVSLLTLPVRPMPEVPGATDQILRPRPDLIDTVLTLLGERFPQLTREEIMALINLPTDHLRDTRFGRELIAEGEAMITLRQLNRRCGPLGEATSARIQALPLEQLEALSEALLDFCGPADLAAWLASHAA
jgi:predicted transposase YdaD